jgi:uncharacterized iron-regulated membrane protein
LWRTLVIAHRYLGIATGLLMVMWFLSGIVMMYVGFPRVTEGARMRTLVPISWQACCRFDDRIGSDGDAILKAQVENLAGTPVMRLQRPGRPDASLDLSQGALLRVDADRARAIAVDAAPRIIGRPARFIAADQIQTDQWTVGRLLRDRPLYRFEFDDAEHTYIYVSGSAGQVMHWVTATQRFWSWLGAIPHWLYFSDLRSNVALWSQIVIWASIIGTFLTVVGICLGVTQFRPGSADKLSPYSGLFYWHHVAGLLFGLATLTWVVSGLVSMNPWGFLESRRTGGEQARVQGPPPTWREVRDSLDAIHLRGALAGAVSLVTAPLSGKLFWLAAQEDGNILRLDAVGNITDTTAADLAQAAQRIAGGVNITESAMMDQEDAYYFDRGVDVFVLPVYRITLNDADNTRYYLNPSSGALLQRTDANGRWYRWLFAGLHRIDFTPWLRTRPARDIIVLALMLGGLGLTLTGCYLAFRRVRNDVATLFHIVRR